MGFRLAYLHFILAQSQGQGYSHLNCEYLSNDDSKPNIIAIKYEVKNGLSISIFKFDLCLF